MSDPSPATRPTWNSQRLLVISGLLLLFLFGAFGVWSVRVNISGAVIGLGMIEAPANMTTVQHPIGGVVIAILARDGDSVQAGDVVLRLDDWQLRSDLKVVEGDLFENLANIARLEAAIDARPVLALDRILVLAASDSPDLQSLINRHQRQLDAEFAARQTESQLLDEQIHQVRAQIAGVEAQLAAKADEKAVLAQELQKARELTGKGLMKLSEIFALQRNDMTMRGELGRLAAQIAELKGKISELELKRHSVAPEARQLAVTELSKLRPERTRHLERRASILDSLSKLEIRAPIAGKIHDSKVLGLRSVIVAASPLMLIIPETDPVFVGVRIFATDIDQVFVGQDASLKFKSFNGRTIPVILGRVASVSADAFNDPVTRKPYYDVRVGLRTDEMHKLGAKDLIPGMPVEAFLATESRTPMNYVLRPILTYFDRAFRDS